jgi:CRP/FNR family transcriptional regulator
MNVAAVPAGATLFDERSPCLGFPLLLEGGIRVVKSGGNGRELLLYQLSPGDSCIISSSCLLGGIDYNARGIAEIDSRLAVLPRSVFEELIQEPVFRRFVFEAFSARIGNLMQLIEEVTFHRLDQRLARLLLGRGPLVHTTHQQLADELGSVREIVSRLLKGFAQQAFIRLGREQIEILDAAGLRRMAS